MKRKDKVAGLIFIVMFLSSCSSFNRINLKKVDRSTDQRNVVERNNDTTNQEELEIVSLREQDKTEYTCESTPKKNTLPPNKFKQGLFNVKAGNVLRPLQTEISASFKKLKKPSQLENNIDRGQPFFDSLNVIRWLILICIVGMVICVLIAGENGVILPIYIIFFFFLASIIGLLIYAAIIGVFGDVIGSFGPFIRH